MEVCSGSGFWQFHSDGVAVTASCIYLGERKHGEGGEYKTRISRKKMETNDLLVMSK